MKIEVFRPAEEKEKVIKFVLNQRGFDISLAAVDNDGRILYYVLDVKADGTFYRHPNVDRELGLQLDDNGRIKESYDFTK